MGIEVVVVAAVVALFLSNGGWTWIQKQIIAYQSKQGNVIARQILSTPVNTEYIASVAAPIKTDQIALIHQSVDHWLALGTLLCNDTESIAALDVIKAKILVVPVAETK